MSTRQLPDPAGKMPQEKIEERSAKYCAAIINAAKHIADRAEELSKSKAVYIGITISETASDISVETISDL